MTCVTTCAATCVTTCAATRVDMCNDVCKDTFSDVCADMCNGMCKEVSSNTCKDMHKHTRTDMQSDLCSDVCNRRVGPQWYEQINRFRPEYQSAASSRGTRGRLLAASWVTTFVTTCIKTWITTCVMICVMTCVTDMCDEVSVHSGIDQSIKRHSTTSFSTWRVSAVLSIHCRRCDRAGSAVSIDGPWDGLGPGGPQRWMP